MRRSPFEAVSQLRTEKKERTGARASLARANESSDSAKAEKLAKVTAFIMLKHNTKFTQPEVLFIARCH